MLNTVKAVYSRLVSRRLYDIRTRFFRRRITPRVLVSKLRRGRHDGENVLKSFKTDLRVRFFISDLNKKEFYINLLTSLGKFDSIMDDADTVHENKYKVLGSDLYSFGSGIDWHLDFKSGKRWPLKYHTSIDLIGSGEGSDVKVPWELSRFHQAIWLGKAYWISRNETHAAKFRSLVDDWIDNNPPGYGVNWTTPMEAAIRAMNLIVGLLYFMDSFKIDDSFLLKLLCSLFEHGVFIRHNLERSIPSHNHLISNLVGLIYLGIFFHDTREGKRWVEFASGELQREIVEQVHRDGTDYEKSTSYQRLTAELFSAAFVLLKLNSYKIDEEFAGRLEKMYDFIAAATTHDGKTPNIGDADDGRLFKMKMNCDFNDHRDIIAVGAALFESNSLKSISGSFSELGLLLLGTQGFEKYSSLKNAAPTSSAIFKEGGFAFLRSEKDFCSFDFGETGLRGRGGHGHNDVLSFTLSGKIPFIVDRGTYCYTPNPKLRNRLRSTYSHNTAVVDGTELSEFAGLWSIREDATNPLLLKWESSEEQNIVEAEHHAYERLQFPVIHIRKITFNKRQRTFLIEDEFRGEGTHTIELFFHFDPDVAVVNLGRKFLVAEGDEFALVKFQHDFTLENWEHSPSYGIIQQARTARVKISGEIPLKIETFIFILSDADGVNHILNRLK